MSSGFRVVKQIWTSNNSLIQISHSLSDETITTRTFSFRLSLLTFFDKLIAVIKWKRKRKPANDPQNGPEFLNYCPAHFRQWKDHFRVVICLWFKTSLRANFFHIKWVWFGKISVQEKHIFIRMVFARRLILSPRQKITLKWSIPATRIPRQNKKNQ